VNDDTVEKHSAVLFDKLDLRHVGSVNLDDFEKYCLHVRRRRIEINIEFCMFFI
jgi:hypothetical protein